jgi:ribosomal protein L21E
MKYKVGQKVKILMYSTSLNLRKTKDDSIGKTGTVLECRDNANYKYFVKVEYGDDFYMFKTYLESELELLPIYETDIYKALVGEVEL